MIYTDIDALLDTRLATIAKISEEAAESALRGNYHKRESDSFPVDMAAYEALYAKRDREILSSAMLTAAVPLLRHLTQVLAEQAIDRPYHSGVKIVVNLHPYELLEEEVVEIGKAIAAQMFPLTQVEVVNMLPKDLTPSHCKSAYGMMVKYDYAAWMELHSQAFNSTLLPEVRLFGPALFEEKPTAEQLAETTREVMHPVRAAELVASPLIGLELIDVKYFSILDAKSIAQVV